MKQLFKEKTSRFGSLISLIAITAMLAIFSMAVPEFLSSTLGRTFAVVWALAAIIVFVAHAKRVKEVQRRHYCIPIIDEKKEVRTRNGVRTNRIMRG